MYILTRNIKCANTSVEISPGKTTKPQTKKEIIYYLTYEVKKRVIKQTCQKINNNQLSLYNRYCRLF